METQRQYGVECAHHEEKIDNIVSDVKEIKSDVKTMLPAVAVLATEVGSLKQRMTQVESQMNWAKWGTAMTGIVLAIAKATGNL
jgi:peptidoglycan hydrolase CwlO-like protein